MRLARVIWLLLCGLLLPTACVPSTSPLSARLQMIQRRGTLLVGTAITRPFEYYDEHGQLIGFDVDLMNLIAQRLNVTVQWREMAFADLLDELQLGTIDAVIAAMYIRPDREELVDFTQPYLDTGLVMIVAADETAITSLADLAGRTVGVKEGSTGENYARRLQVDEKIALELRRYTETLDSLNDVRDGLVDVVFNDRLNSLVYIQNNPQVKIQGEVLEAGGLGIAVQTGDVELLTFIDGVLTELKRNGQITALFDEWINPQTVGQ
jgi:ABC-type amino acid transport substrate-binding protein